MILVEILANEYGGHDNQYISQPITPPDGWAVVPDDLATENFPFGDITVEEIDGVMTVTSWTPGVMPEPIPEPEPVEPDSEPSVWDELDAAYQEGVNDV